MSLDTAQPATAAETEGLPVSREDALNDAASAFKVHLGQEDAPAPRARQANGQFAPADGAETGDEAGEEIEAEATAEAESQEDAGEDDGAADEAQPTAAALPASWPTEHAELWNALPPEAQGVIAEREGQRDAAVNAKFQEAANLRKSFEGEINEAKSTREKALRAMDVALAAIRPQEPPLAMLNVNSDLYDPDGYHLAKAQYDHAIGYLNDLATQRDQLRAQEKGEDQQAATAMFESIQASTAPAFLRDVPDVADQAKAPAVFQGLIEYAVNNGAPMELFQSPTTAFEWHQLWKAREYDRIQAAKGKVQTEPKPEPRRAGPAVRPGVSTPPSARRAAVKQNNLDRLMKSGSIEAGAAVWKDILKG